MVNFFLIIIVFILVSYNLVRVYPILLIYILFMFLILIQSNAFYNGILTYTSLSLFPQLSSPLPNKVLSFLIMGV